VLLAQLELRGPLEVLEVQVTQDLVDQLGRLAHPEPLDHKVILDRMETMVHPDQLVLQD